MTPFHRIGLAIYFPPQRVSGVQQIKPNLKYKLCKKIMSTDGLQKILSTYYSASYNQIIYKPNHRQCTICSNHITTFDNSFTIKLMKSLPMECISSELRRWKSVHSGSKSREPLNLKLTYKSFCHLPSFPNRLIYNMENYKNIQHISWYWSFN